MKLFSKFLAVFVALSLSLSLVPPTRTCTRAAIDMKSQAGPNEEVS